eukprot:215269-Alexandrium_andersonii.AAC.1
MSTVVPHAWVVACALLPSRGWAALVVFLRRSGWFACAVPPALLSAFVGYVFQKRRALWRPCSYIGNGTVESPGVAWSGYSCGSSYNFPSKEGLLSAGLA